MDSLDTFLVNTPTVLDSESYEHAVAVAPLFGLQLFQSAAAVTVVPVTQNQVRMCAGVSQHPSIQAPYFEVLLSLNAP
jgi:hypothetical protein